MLKNIFPSSEPSGFPRPSQRKRPPAPRGPVLGLPPAKDRSLWPGLLAFFLTVLGARCWLIWTYGSAMPFWDQWGAEGEFLLMPWHRGELTWAKMFAPHNEHRIFLTRVLVLALYRVGGQWDAQVEAAVNAVFYAGFATVVAGWLRRRLGPGWGPALLLGLGVMFALPIGWENTLCGFQSQFYLLLIFSLLTLWGLGTRPVFSPGWWSGAISGVAACFSMATGFLAAGVVLGWTVGKLLRERRWPPGTAATTLVCLGVVGLGCALQIAVPVGGDSRAGSPAVFLAALGRCLAWPRGAAPGWALLMDLPLTLLAAGFFLWPRTSTSRPGEAALEETILLVGGWVGLQAVAMAYARGSQSVLPVRYLDLLSFGALANTLAAWLLATRWWPGRDRRLRVAARLGAAAWTVFLLVGAVEQTVVDFRHILPGWRTRLAVEERHVRAYVAYGGMHRLPEEPMFTIPYLSAEGLAKVLDDPFMRSALPAVIREPLRLVPAPSEAGAVTPSCFGQLPEALQRGEAAAAAAEEARAPAWGTFGQGGAADQGTLWFQVLPGGTLAYWQWEFAGGLGGSDPGLSLTAETGDGERRREQELRPDRASGENWRRQFLRASRAGSCTLIAVDRSATGWFGWRAPVEVSWLSYWTGWGLRRGAWMFWVGASCLLAFAAASGLRGVYARGWKR